MKELAFIVGILAVCIYLLGYLQKKRKAIILLNLTSRVLYVVQYILLGAFEGAGLDICGAISSVLAQRKDSKFIKKYSLPCFILVNIAIIAVGIILWSDAYSILPIIGVLLHTSAFWLSDEKYIRIVSLLGCPFWLVYNFANAAYGSCIGDLLSITFIVYSIIRYDIPKSKRYNKKKNDNTLDS